MMMPQVIIETNQLGGGGGGIGYHETLVLACTS